MSGQRADGEQDAVDLAGVLAGVDDTWSPRTVAVMNDYDVRVVKAEGEFTRHSHPETDELFLVVRGCLTIRMDAGDVLLGPGQLYVVPRGVPHQPVSVEGAELLLVEPSTTVNTGDTPSALTAPRRLPDTGGAAAVDAVGAARGKDVSEGGEPACLLHQVCPDCGRLAESEPPTTSPGCGRALLPA